MHIVANAINMVPDAIVQEAMNAGCAPISDEDQAFIDEQGNAKVEFVGNMRRSLIWLAIDVLVRENNSKNFGGGGAPSKKVLSDRLGFDIAAKELTVIWQEYNTTKSQGLEPSLHPEAPQAMEVLGAEDGEELRALATEFGVAPSAIEGLSTKEIRRTLLAKFSGISQE